YLGLVQRDLSDRQLVSSSTSRAVSLARSFYPGNAAEMGKAYYNAMQCLSGLDAPETLSTYADSALYYYRIVQDDEKILWSLNARATGYLESGKYEETLKSYREAQQILSRRPGAISELGYVYYNLGICYERMKNWPAALENSRLAIRTFSKTDDSIALGQSYHSAGRHAGKLDRKKEAINYFNAALAVFLDEEHIPNQLTAAGIPSARINLVGEFLEDRAEFYEDAGDLNQALADYNLALSLQDQIRADLNSEESQRYISENLRPLFQRAIHLQYRLFQEDGDEEHLWEALSLAERSKAFSLLSALKRKESEAPKRERELRRQIAKLERTPNSAVSSQQLDAARLELDRLLNQTREETPDPPQLDIDKLKNYLAAREIHLLEFAIGDGHSYLFHLTPDGQLQMHPVIAGEKLPEQIADFRKAIRESAYREISLREDQATLDETYAGAGWALYSQLFVSFAEVGRNPLPKRSLIVPDGVLGLLPFGALLTAPQGEGTLDYQHVPYLQRDRQLHYSYSAQYLLELERADAIKYRGNLLALAPSFQGATASADLLSSTRSVLQNTVFERSLPGLLPLRYNREEVEKVSALIPASQAFFADKASRKRFEQQSAAYYLLLISSHALVNADDPNQSFIAFSQTGDSLETEEMLFLNDLYSLSLQSELAVLSACETSLGRIAPGEGILSLARAFAQAGAASTLTTLWKVDDEATKELIVEFFNQLKAGSSRAEAVAQAQETAYASATFAHPYYWSALTLYGRGDTIELPVSPLNWWLIGGGSLVLLLGFLGWRRRR
ncbi:MAG: CHAT domain-containing protein, partial [Bacteroidota bacterium]